MEAAAGVEPILRVDLLLCPGAVASVALLVADCCVARIHDADASRRLHLAAFELVENAVKYSSGRLARVELELETRSDDERWLTLRVHNEADADRLEEIARRFTGLRPPSDAIDHYDRLIVEAASKPIGLSGLGLARIRAEGGLELDCAVDGRSLTVTARARIRPEVNPSILPSCSDRKGLAPGRPSEMPRGAPR
ncbi:MAG TPA: ATP-binding protein [Polyangiaceae bacterium]|nr:ATP-binding protein [Polyangiaceae bacterium]